MPRPSIRPSFLSEPPPAGTVGAPYPRATLELRTITPVVGGGVDTFEPDKVEGVRVPGIRGQLRWWWRQLYARKGETADQLFEREARLWGGVGVQEGDDAEVPGLRSVVQVQATAQPGWQNAVKPAGEHPARPGKIAGAAPRWFDNPRDNVLGYALFPLQQDEEERKRGGEGRSVPTKSIRQELRFRLVLTWRSLRRSSPPETALPQVLAALWAWIHLGGIGARTRRGFGAVELATALSLENFPSEVEPRWLRLFDPTDNRNLETRLRELPALGNPSNPDWPPRLLAGAGTNDPLRALKSLLRAMQAFRQGRDVGRDPGTRFPVGRSRWPEPNLLRLLADPTANWEHPIPEGLAEQLRDMGAPRAAFGLPIEAKFKEDRSGPPPGRKADSDANARILPSDDRYERWASPVLLRPVPDGRSYRPLVVLLRGERPSAVRLEVAGKKAVVPVARVTGSRDLIKTYLGRAKGNALEAFAAWLKDKRGFREIRVGADPGGAHA